MIDYLIVGCGLFGATFARIATDNGKKCLIIDKRPHIGGNCYTSKQHGIDIHEYGAHIFHTPNEKVWSFITQFAEFNNYQHKIKASYNGNLFLFPINLFTLYQLWGVKTPQEARDKLDSVKILSDTSNLKGWILNELGKEIYETFFEEYTRKQWGKDPSELPSTIAKRLPIRLTFDDNLFPDKYQGIPTDGYTALFTRLLNGITVELGIDFFSNQKKLSSLAKQIVYTGPIDQLFGYTFGKLEYRSLRFEQETHTGDYQGCSVLNYTDSTAYTRIIEHKHFTIPSGETTIITKEYPSSIGDPYYPICDKSNNELYHRYKKICQPNIILGGRLAQYKYLDMHQVIGSAIRITNEIFSTSI